MQFKDETGNGTLLGSDKHTSTSPMVSLAAMYRLGRRWSLGVETSSFTQAHTFNAGGDAVTALLSGSIDVSFVGPSPTVNAYVQSHGEDLYQRSLYTFWKRTIAPPEMINFDSANREACVVRESRTSE